MGKIIAVCMSETRGTEKKNIGRAYLKEDWGLEGDCLLYTSDAADD